MTELLKTKWITIRANPLNKQQLWNLSLCYSKSQSEIVKQLITDTYQQIEDIEKRTH